MTAPVRYIVALSDDWTISVSGPGGPVLPAPNPLWPGTGPDLAPAGTPLPRRFLYQLWKEGTSPALPDLYDKIFTYEDYARQDIEQMGRFLFDRLLGDATWNAIGAAAAATGVSVIELALRFAGTLHELHRFPWELMHGPSGFLAHGDPSASVTRLVSGTAASPASGFSSPPKLLFVVGASLTDRRIRPGAEIFGLLRQLNARGLTVNTRTLLSASTESLGRTVGEFGPDLVHFTCHGDIEGDGQVARGFLEFQREDKKDVVHRNSDHLLAYLKSGQRLPPVVVLSACYSGVMPPAAPGAGPQPPGIDGPPRAAAADRIGSLAAELVAGGVPVVIGMGGRVADSACRLFTRSFGEALVRGDPLVAAVARGRRAAFVDGVPDTADWAYPVLFLDEKVPETYAPAYRPLGQPDPSLALALRIQEYSVPRYPVFCGRHEVFERYHQLFQPGIPPRLPVFSRGDGLGRSRLLKELAAQALRDGHIPCLLSSDHPGWPDPPFSTAVDLAVEILRALDRARAAFGLPPPSDSSLLGQLISVKARPDLAARLPGLKKRSEFLSTLQDAHKSPGEGPSADVCRAALQEDFEALIAEARTSVPPLAGKESRALLLLDDVHKYDGAIRPLLHTLIKGFGLGTLQEPVPVILCYALGTPADAFFTEATETIGSHALELKPFSEAEDEDLLNYEQVLLFPDEADGLACEFTEFIRKKLKLAIEGKVVSYAINHRARGDIRDQCTDTFRLSIQGIPQKMKEREMHVSALGAYRAGFLVLGDDEARLRKL